MNSDDRIHELEAKVEQLSALVERLTDRDEHRASEEVPLPEATSSRRGMLKLAGAAAVGAAAAAVSGVGRAAADNGLATTSTTSATMLNYTGTTATAAFLFQSGTDFAPGTSGFPCALAGWSDGTDNVPNGIYGYTAKSGIAVVAVGAGVGSTGVLASGVRSNLRLVASGVAAPLRTTSTYLQGDIVNDSTGAVWLCVTAGTPGTWRQLSGPTASGSLHLLASPKRVYDSRVGAAPAVDPKTPLVNITPRTIDCKANTSGVPAGATGVLLNVTVVSVTASGFLAVTPGGAGFTGTSTLNWSTANAVIANSVTTACGTGATVDLTAGGGGATNAIVDVFGYYL